MSASSASPHPTPDPTLSERLLLSAIRDWAALRLSDERPNRRVALALAFRSSNRVAGLFVAWMQAVETVLRRPIQIRCPVCGGVSTDEQRLIVSCGLAGTASALGEQLLEPLLTDGQTVMVLARALNAALRAEGYPLPVRLRDRPVEHEVARPTVH
ncbi:hypothetical protein BH10PSE4_BH10PSE4_15040 [soil metagenome]